jgi:hypothetical protein
MKIDGRLLIVFIMALVFIPGAYAGSISVGGGISISGTGSGQGNFASNGVQTTDLVTLKGMNINADYWVQGAAGERVEVDANVPSADSAAYRYSLSPASQTPLEAQEWLDVTNAQTSIQADAKASTGKGDQANVGIRMGPGSLAGYTNSATATDTQVTAQQSATSGSGNSITISCGANDSSGTYSVNTPLSGSVTGLSDSSLAGTTTQVSQIEQVIGSFSSTATAPGGITNTRTSNFGTKYDLNMLAAKGGSPTGVLGYHVDPSMATSTLGAIQGSVNAAQSGDTINAAAGTYNENVNIDKSLTVNGAGVGITIVNGGRMDSVFTIGANNANIDVTLSGMTITNGETIGGGGIFNYGTLNLNNVLVTGNTAKGYGGGIENYEGTVNLNAGSWITGNTAAADGGGIYNERGTVNMYTGSTIDYNTVEYGGYGGGISNGDGDSGYGGTVNMNGGSITDNTAGYYGGGIYNYEGTVNLNAGSIVGNTATSGYGGGIYNDVGSTVKGDTSLVHDNSPDNIYP